MPYYLLLQAALEQLNCKVIAINGGSFIKNILQFEAKMFKQCETHHI